ncbi:MAG: PAS domain-containing protein, partial [Sulfurimonas sp.]|nr:PAS domain-containing protein [Sulfurimonas sp.]
IVRHRDMPKAAFKNLWATIKKDEIWNGYVKNATKDGGFYWVHATAMRKVHSDGSITYLSVRRVPDRGDVNACITLYAELRAKE